MKAKALVLGLLMSLSLAGHAQFDFGGEATSSSPWKEFKLNPKTRIKLDFRNANADMVISLLSKVSGVTIVKDPALKTPLTITSPKPVSLDEAFQILSTVVSLAGYDLRKEGNLLVVRKKPDASANRGGRGGMAAIAEMMGGGGEQGAAGGAASRAQLKVYRIEHASANQVARVINEVFANQQAQNQPQFGFGGINFGGGGGRGGGNNQGGRQAAGRQQPTVRASSDDYSNTVIVNAPSREQEQVETLIKQIDKPSEQPQQSKVFKLVYAAAADIAPVVQNVLVSNAPRGRGGSGNQNIPFEQRFQAAARLGGTQAAFGTVVAEPRTNSIVVTATEQNMTIVEQVVKELDQEIQIQNSTFVFPLDNARADQTATLLNQAFSGRTTGTTGGGFGNNQNRFGGGGNPFNRGGGGGGFGGGGGGFGGGNPASATRVAPDPSANELDVNLADPTATAGPLATEVAVSQGFGFQIFGGGNQNRQAQPPARDAQGRVTNVQQLAGQVTVIADPNTNSLIVVATPENAEMVRQILGQLDRIPEQVMIETLIVEATLDSTTKLGVEWKFTQDSVAGTNATGSGGVNFGQQSAAVTGSGFRYTVAGANFEAFVNALKTDSKFEVLSTPRIFTSNNTQAEINISQSVPYVLSTREDANGNLTFNYAFQDVGIVLTVTPRITANGFVTMDVSQTANDLQGFTSFNAPIVNQRQAQTTVSVKDGETVILGGIIRTTVNSTVRKVPLLGDIPILGNLFRSTERTRAKTELLVFLTPHVVRSVEDATRERERNQSQLAPKTQKAIDNALGKGSTTGGKP